MKIKTDQLKNTSKVCPISGWAASNKPIINVIKKENIYLKYILEYFSLVKINAINMIKNGFTNSIGWNLGKRYKSIHLWELFISIPINGTKNNEISDNKKIMGEILKSLSSLIEDRTNIINIPNKTKDKCLKKNA